MRNATTPRPRDPDFDDPRPAGSSPDPGSARFYQRLVVNPFLGAFAFLLSLLVCAWLAASSILMLIVPSFGLGILAGYSLLQYHCLDCGSTGPYHAWPHHACAAVRGRWDDRSSLSSRIGFPAAPAQLALWIIGFFVFLCFGALATGRV